MSLTTERLIRISEVRRMAAGGEARRIRERAGLSLSEVAEALGVEGTTVWRWEEGKSVPRKASAEAYFDLLERLQR